MLEYNDRAGGRNWSLRGGDTLHRNGRRHPALRVRSRALSQSRALAHSRIITRGMLDYCKRLERGARAVHAGQLQRLYPCQGVRRQAAALPPRSQADFSGHIAELLAKAGSQGKLDDAVTKEDKEMLLEALRFWGALDKNYEYKKGRLAERSRGYDVGSGRRPRAACRCRRRRWRCSDMLDPGSGSDLSPATSTNTRPRMFQPVGGMGMIGKAFAREARRHDPIQFQGHRDPAGRQRRHRRPMWTPRPAARRRPRRRLVRLHHSRSRSSARFR